MQNKEHYCIWLTLLTYFLQHEQITRDGKHFSTSLWTSRDICLVRARRCGNIIIYVSSITGGICEKDVALVMYAVSAAASWQGRSQTSNYDITYSGRISPIVGEKLSNRKRTAKPIYLKINQSVETNLYNAIRDAWMYET